MSAAKLELTGGGFQDSEGNVLALGYLVFKLSQDSEVNGSQICSGVEITINLDAVGNAATGQYIWGNDALSPVNSYYTVTGYTAEGQPAWGPNNQQVVGTGTFNLGSWIPNQVISWVPPVQAGTSIEVEGTALSSASVADFVNTGNVTFTDAGGGQIEATATGLGTSIQIAGTPLSSSTVADFVNTGNVTFTDLGSGHIQAVASGGMGQPIVALPYNQRLLGSVTPIANTACQQMPQNQILCYPSRSKVTIQSSSTASGCLVSSFVLAVTLPNDLNVISFTPITYGGLASFTIPLGTRITSDPIPLQIDAAHDYWFLIYGYNVTNYWLESMQAGNIGPFFGGYMGTGVTDLTAVTPIQNPPCPSGLFSLWVGAWEVA